MTGYLTDYRGQQFKLPLFLKWDITHTDGKNGTDCFEVQFPYSENMKDALEDAVSFRLVYRDKTVFYGLVDEYEVSVSENGKIAALLGRGMGARLIDNKCLGAEYISCTLEQILKTYAYPYGIKTGMCDTFPPMYGYTVDTGQSALSAISGFTEFGGDITPRFSPEGLLMLTKQKGERYSLDTDCAYDMVLRSRRSDILSQVTVVTADGVQTVVKNQDFLDKGGASAAVITVPRKTSWDMIRYTGAYQIEKSRYGRYSLEITVSDLFPVFPCDVVEINCGFCEKGEYTVTETCCFGDENGMGTRLYLTKEV